MRRLLFITSTACAGGGGYRHAGLLVCCLWLLVPSQAQAQQEPSPCENAIAEARDKYARAYYQETIDLLEGCLELGAFSGEQRPIVYEWLAKSYHKLGEMVKVLEILDALCLLDPAYKDKLNPGDPGFEEFVEVHPCIAPTPSNKRWIKRLLWGGGSAVVGTGLAWFLTRNGTPGGLPFPPDRPSGN